MGDDYEPLRRAIGDLGRTIQHAGNLLRAQAAMGWMYRGDLAQARTALADTSPDVLRQVSAAAAALSGLADELLAEARPPLG